MKISSVLVLCTGNICRSPLAEKALQALVADRGIEVGSAGTAAVVGAPADPYSVQVGDRLQLDLHRHVARQATLPLLLEADLLLALDGGHRHWVGTRAPQLAGRVFRLGHWDGDRDVPDPYGAPLAAFETVGEQILRSCRQWADRLGR